MKDKVGRHLAQAEQAELIRLAEVAPDPVYLFRHALVQEAAYGSLLRQNRRTLHRAVGEALEQLYPDRREELAPVLARHFAEAADPRALDYFRLAGDADLRRHANTEAVTHYSRALELAEPAGAGDDLLRHLYAQRGRALELSARYAEAVANYEAMGASARTRGDRRLELAALTARATLHVTPNPASDPALGKRLLEEALTLARAMADRAAEARILWNLMLIQIYTLDDQQQALAYGERSLALARAIGDREQVALTLTDLCHAYLGSGQPARSEAALAEAQDLWRQLDNLPMLAESFSTLAQTCFLTGCYAEAAAHAEAALRISRSIGNLRGQVQSHFMVCAVYLERGELTRAIRSMEEAVRLGEQCGHPAAVTGTCATLGWLYGNLGMLERGEALARQGVARSEAGVQPLRAWATAVLTRLHLLRGDLVAARAGMADTRRAYAATRGDSSLRAVPVNVMLAEGELALASGEPARAAGVMDELLALLARLQTRPYVADALTLKGKALQAEDRLEEAEACLAAARAAAEALGARWSLWPALLGLSQLAARRGDEAAARDLRRRARRLIGQLAGEIDSPELRASFLATAAVRAAYQDEA